MHRVVVSYVYLLFIVVSHVPELRPSLACETPPKASTMRDELLQIRGVPLLATL